MTLPADTCILGNVYRTEGAERQNRAKGEHKQQCLAVLANNLGWADLENIAGLSWDRALHNNSASLRVHPQNLQDKGQTTLMGPSRVPQAIYGAADHTIAPTAWPHCCQSGLQQKEHPPLTTGQAGLPTSCTAPPQGIDYKGAIHIT